MYRGEQLVVRAAGPDYLLAMKLRASRPEDLRDDVQLATETGRAMRGSLYELIRDGYWRGTVIADIEAFVTEVLANIDQNNSEFCLRPYRSPGDVGGVDV